MTAPEVLRGYRRADCMRNRHAAKSISKKKGWSETQSHPYRLLGAVMLISIFQYTALTQRIQAKSYRTKLFLTVQANRDNPFDIKQMRRANYEV